MTQRGASGRGFTLIELMIVVAILGIIAAIAIPAFRFFVSRSKSAEVASNLNNLFKSSAAYYNAERSGQGGGSSTTGNCVVPSAAPRPATPGANKQKFSNAGVPGFEALNFTVSDYVYYSYSFDTQGTVGSCGWPAGTTALYTFLAQGDLDGDGIRSTFELAAGSDHSNTLYHARGMYIQNEGE